MHSSLCFLFRLFDMYLSFNLTCIDWLFLRTLHSDALNWIYIAVPLQLSLRRQQVSEKLNEWTVFNEKYKELCEWLTNMESKVSQNGDISIEEMIEKLRKVNRNMWTPASQTYLTFPCCAKSGVSTVYLSYFLIMQLVPSYLSPCWYLIFFIIFFMPSLNIWVYYTQWCTCHSFSLHLIEWRSRRWICCCWGSRIYSIWTRQNTSVLPD